MASQQEVSRPKMNQVKPSKEAMLICDQIINEAVTNKKSLVGIFEQICAEKLPCTHPDLSVYVKFTGALGDYNFELVLVDLTTDQVIGKAALPTQRVPDKLGSYELVFNLMNLKFQNAGKYEFRIFADGDLFGIKSFSVIQRPS